MDSAAAFFNAVTSGSHDLVRTMLRENPPLASVYNSRSFGATPLIHAAGVGDRAMIDILIDAGADPNQRSDWWAGGFGPLDDGNDETADHLLRRGAILTPHAAARLGRIDDLRRLINLDPRAVYLRGGDGQLPLHFSKTPEIAEFLLACGAEIDALDLDHEGTAAQWCLPERPNVTEYLVMRGSRFDPFMAAAIGDLNLMERAVAGEDDGVRVRITRSRFPTSEKAAGHIYLFTIGENCTPLHAAAGADQAAAVRWLAAKGADVNARGGYDDQTPLHAAAWRNCPAAAAALLDAGADINIVSGSLHDNEPVGWAILSGAVETVRLLISRGCRVRNVHHVDAQCGAKGQWRCLNRRLPLEAWREIEREIAAAM